MDKDDFEIGRIIREGLPEIIEFRTVSGVVRGIPLWAGEVGTLNPGYTAHCDFVGPWDHPKRVRFILVEDLP